MVFADSSVSIDSICVFICSLWASCMCISGRTNLLLSSALMLVISSIASGSTEYGNVFVDSAIWYSSIICSVCVMGSIACLIICCRYCSLVSNCCINCSNDSFVLVSILIPFSFCTCSKIAGMSICVRSLISCIVLSTISLAISLMLFPSLVLSSGMLAGSFLGSFCSLVGVASVGSVIASGLGAFASGSVYCLSSSSCCACSSAVTGRWL